MYFAQVYAIRVKKKFNFFLSEGGMMVEKLRGLLSIVNNGRHVWRKYLSCCCCCLVVIFNSPPSLSMIYWILYCCCFNLSFNDFFSCLSCADLNYCGTHEPCQNGGTCENPAPDEYLCKCPEGFSGMNCQVVDNLCATTPCLHGSTCTETDSGGFNCTCAPGWTGSTCEISKYNNDCNNNDSNLLKCEM